MTFTVPIISIGDELGIELPTEVVTRMGIDQNSIVYVYSRGDEIQLSTSKTPPDGWTAFQTVSQPTKVE